MNAGQRKAHKIIWILLVLGLPVFMYLSINHRSSNALELHCSNKERPSVALPDSAAKNDLIKVTYGEGQLNVQLLRPIKSAATLIYTLDKDGRSQQLLGQISDARTYVFSIQEEITGILLFDPVKKSEITKLLF